MEGLYTLLTPSNGIVYISSVQLNVEKVNKQERLCAMDPIQTQTPEETVFSVINQIQNVRVNRGGLATALGSLKPGER